MRITLLVFILCTFGRRSDFVELLLGRLCDSTASCDSFCGNYFKRVVICELLNTKKHSRDAL